MNILIHVISGNTDLQNWHNEQQFDYFSAIHVQKNPTEEETLFLDKCKEREKVLSCQMDVANTSRMHDRKQQILLASTECRIWVRLGESSASISSPTMRPNIVMLTHVYIYIRDIRCLWEWHLFCEIKYNVLAAKICVCDYLVTCLFICSLFKDSQ